MPTVVASTDVDAPPERIWALLDDPNNYPEMAVPTERMVEVPTNPIREGATYKEYGGIKPFMAESEWTVTEYRPHRFQRHVGEEPTMRFDLAIELKPLEDGSRTRFTQTLAMKPAWFLVPVNAVLWPLMMRNRAQAAMDGTVENLKRMAESPTE